MSRLPNGLRKVGGGWKDPLWRRPVKPAAVIVPVKSPEEIEAIAEQRRADLASFIERQTADFDAYVRSVHPKVADREARMAVEGDTDLNHDNVEAAPVDHYARDTADVDRTRVLLANCIMNCGTRIYQGDDHLVVPPNDEFYCAKCVKAEAAE